MIPNAVKAAPDARKMVPSFRFPDVSTVGSDEGIFPLDTLCLRRCLVIHFMGQTDCLFDLHKNKQKTR